MPGQFGGNNLNVNLGGSQLNGKIGGNIVFSTVTVPTVIAPTVSALSFSSIGTDRVTISWTLGGDTPTTTMVEYGQTTSYGFSTTLSNPAATSVTVAGLSSGTTYHFRITATNSAGSGSNTGSQATMALPTYTFTGNITDNVTNATVSPSSYSVSGVAGSTHDVEITVTPDSGYRFTAGTDISISGLGSSLSLLNRQLQADTSVTAEVRVTIGSSNQTDNFAVGGTAQVVPSQPRVTTGSASPVTTTSMTINGSIISTGGSMITARFFEYGTSSTNLNNTVSATGNVSFLASISSLTPGTTYYYRAGATNSAGLTGYGSVESQATRSLSVPSVSTLAPQSVTETSATFTGQQTDTGGATVTERGFYYRQGSGLSLDPSDLSGWTKVTDDSTTGGLISEGVTGLTANTAYTVVAFATNSVGTGFGGSRTFTSDLIVLPKISSFAATADGQTEVDLAWSVSNADRLELDYGLTMAYGTMVTVSATDTSASVTGLTAGTQYFFRLRAFNDDGSDVEVTSATTQAATYSGDISYALADNVSSTDLSPTSYSGLAAGASISYSGTLNAAIGYQFIDGSTSTDVSGTVNVPSAGGDITVDLTSTAVSMAADEFTLSDLEAEASGTIPSAGLAVGADVSSYVRFGAYETSVSSVTLRTAIPARTQTTSGPITMDVTISGTIPPGFPDESATYNFDGSFAIQQAGAPPVAIDATAGSFSTDSVTIDTTSTDLDARTAMVDVTGISPTNGRWNITAQNGLTVSPSSGSGNRTDIRITWDGTTTIPPLGLRVTLRGGTSSTGTSLDTLTVQGGTII